MNNNSVSLILGFDGEALRNHEMDVKELAPALISFAEMIEEADRVLNNGEHKIDIKVKAFQPGSFEVLLQVLGSIKEQLLNAINLMDSPSVNAMLNLVTTLGLVKCGADSVGLISLLKRISGQTIKETKAGNNSDIEIILSDDSIIKTTKEALELYKSRKVRLAVKGLMKPLNNQQIESITTQLISNSCRDEKMIISKEDIKSFEVEDSNDEKLQENTRETYLQLVTVQMQSGKWRFSDGDSTFYANIEDEDFLEAVKVGTEHFAADDIMQVQLKESQLLGNDGIKNERTILKVISHRSAEKQVELPFDKDRSIKEA